MRKKQLIQAHSTTLEAIEKRLTRILQSVTSDSELTINPGLLAYTTLGNVISATPGGGAGAENRISELMSHLARVGATHTADDVEAARLEGRNEALQAVIDGLKLSKYGYVNPNGYPTFVFGLEAWPEQAGKTGAERLWDDLQTAIQVRAEQSEADKRAATEKSVSRITEDSSSTPHITVGDLIGYGAAQTLSTPERKKTKKGGKKK